MSSCESSLHQGLRALHQLLRLLAVLHPTEEVCREVRVGGSRNHGHPGIGHAVPCRCDHRAVPHHYVCKGKCQAKEVLKSTGIGRLAGSIDLLETIESSLKRNRRQCQTWRRLSRVDLVETTKSDLIKMKIHADAGQSVLGAACSAVIAGKNLEMAPKSCEVLVRIDKQSPDITGGVHVGKENPDVSVVDQGVMFG